VRQPYDSPRWLRTDRPVKFSELVASPETLEVHGRTPDPIRLTLRLPPDLVSLQSHGLPIDLHFRYTAPVERDQSSLTVEVNDRLARVIHLRPDAEADGAQRLVVPLVSTAVLGDDAHLSLPGIAAGADNQLSLRFTMDSHVQGACRERMPDVQRSSIDPDSTIDLTGFAHYVAMPDLSLFAQAGYPFTRLADLSQTVVVLKGSLTPAVVQSFLHVMGQFGRWTGVPATGLRVAGDAAAAKDLEDADLLVLASNSDGLLGSTDSPIGLALGAGSPQLRRLLTESAAGASFDVRAGGSLGLMEGFASPFGHQRSVVTLLTTDDSARRALMDVLDHRAGAVHGDITVVRGDALNSYRYASTYYVGTLPFGVRTWAGLSRHPWLAIVGAVGVLTLLVFLTVGALRRRAVRRLDESSAE
jgi:hypothetical protein